MSTNAYHLVYDHCRALIEAGVPEHMAEEARRLTSGETFNALRAGTRGDGSEESWVKHVEAARASFRDRMKAAGLKL